jgi:hypothetical protein
MSEAWPALPREDWHDTLETLHLWTQVVGKIRLVHSPWLNHSWNVALYVTPTGLTTGLVPYGDQGFELAFDFSRSSLDLTTSAGDRTAIPLLDDTSVAVFYKQVLTALRDVEMRTTISTMPSEIADAVPFPDDHVHSTYRSDHARTFHRVLLSSTNVFERFRSGFLGKASRVHFFWGSFDLAVTRFSGRPAPPHPGGIPNLPDRITREAYSHEVSSAGFWPGSPAAPDPIFYSYAYPTPDGFSEEKVDPAGAVWNQDLGEFVLPYEAVRTAASPDAALDEFLQATYAAAANRAGWDRAALERPFDDRP